jgi:DNA-binding XRE family transcriptional regulator
VFLAPRDHLYVCRYYLISDLEYQVSWGMILFMIDSTKIRELREARGMSTRVFAREAGISTETLYAIEHGKRQPSVTTLGKMARALGVEVKDLFA